MATLLQTSTYYADDDHLQVLNNIATKNLVAMRDSITNLGQSLFIGATKDIVIDASENITINLGASNELTVNDKDQVESLKISTDINTTYITSGLKNLVINTDDNSNYNVSIAGMTISQSNNYQVLTTDSPSGFLIDANLRAESNLVVEQNMGIANNIICNGGMFTSDYNLVKSLEATASTDPVLVGYSFRINSNLQLELLKHASFSNGNKVTRIVSTFGINMLSNNEVSNREYTAYDNMSDLTGLF